MNIEFTTTLDKATANAIFNADISDKAGYDNYIKFAAANYNNNDFAVILVDDPNKICLKFRKSDLYI